MKTYNFLSIILGLIFFLFSACESQLQEEVFSQLDPGKVMSTAEGVETVLFGAYGYSQTIGNLGNNTSFFTEWMTDLCWETGGGANLNAVLMINYTFDASSPNQFTAEWRRRYKAIRNCNLILEEIDNAPLDDLTKERLIAEARFVRASAYDVLYNFHGPVPLRTSTAVDELEMARATDEQMLEFIEKEYLAVVDVLPKKGELPGYEYGRATKGAALGLLTKFYLNTKQWQKCADAAKDLIDLDIYELWPDYKSLFWIENEEVNKEYIYVYCALSSMEGEGNQYMCGAFPPNFAQTVDGSIVFSNNMRNWARQDRLYDSFFNSFDPQDKRLEVIVTEYIDNKGNLVSLLNANNTRAFKYKPDPNAIANDHGNDMPVIRYADILLSRAEALNEIDGPTQEALDLIDEVRNRAGLTTKLNLSDFPSKESLRDRILDERAWEFFTEFKRREDLIRHGKLISKAQERGATNAKDYHVLFPIPQEEINANPLCEQNTGY